MSLFQLIVINFRCVGNVKNAAVSTLRLWATQSIYSLGKRSLLLVQIFLLHQMNEEHLFAYPYHCTYTAHPVTSCGMKMEIQTDNGWWWHGNIQVLMILAFQ